MNRAKSVSSPWGKIHNNPAKTMMMMRIFRLAVVIAAIVVATGGTTMATTTTTADTAATSKDNAAVATDLQLSSYQQQQPQQRHEKEDNDTTKARHPAAAVAFLERQPQQNDGQRRSLFLADLFCPTNLLPLVDCTCKKTLLPPVWSTSCELESNDGIVCNPIVGFVCAVPFVKTSFDLFRLFRLAFPIGVELCYKELSLFNVTLPIFNKLCIDFFDPLGSLLDFFTLGLLPSRSSNRDDDTNTVYAACRAELDGTKCETCQVCNDGMGGTAVILQCGDAFELNTCTTLLAAPLPKSLNEPLDLTKAVPFKLEASSKPQP
jgi:hypothetical protein